MSVDGPGVRILNSRASKRWLLNAGGKVSMPGCLERIGEWEEVAREARFDPKEMAVRCGVSLRHLERFFRRRFDCTPRDWARAIRCRLVVDLIIRGLSDKVIASELWFADTAQLCHEFKRVYGVSPQHFSLPEASCAEMFRLSPKRSLPDSKCRSQTVDSARTKECTVLESRV